MIFILQTQHTLSLCVCACVRACVYMSLRVLCERVRACVYAFVSAHVPMYACLFVHVRASVYVLCMLPVCAYSHPRRLGVELVKLLRSPDI